MKLITIILIILIVVAMAVVIRIFTNTKPSKNLCTTAGIKHISKDTPLSIVIEENGNYGHINLVTKGVHFPERTDHVFNVYNDKDPYEQALKLDTLYTTEIIEQNIDRIHPVNMIDNKPIFTLFRYDIWQLRPPVSTKEPTLCMSLFKPKLADPPSKSFTWAGRYFAAQLKQFLVFNYYFPKGSVRSYLDYFMLESLKEFKPEEFVVGSLVETPHCQYEVYEGKAFDDNKLFARFDKFINDNPQRFKDGFEKFMWYYSIASKIYNDTDDDDTIRNNKGGDFFVYKFTGDFVEQVGGRPAHISDGYIGQLMRYIGLRQVDYKYGPTQCLVPRCTHFVYRDGHTNQVGYNDAQLIESFNKASRNSEKKIYNMIPDNPYYMAPWHSFVNCPADPQDLVIRSAIAGVVQMSNFQDTPQWLSNDVYYKTFGKAFILDDMNVVSFKNHRPLQDKGGGNIVSAYMYGIEEYMFSTLFYLEYFKNKNVYYPYKFLSEVFRFYKEGSNLNKISIVEFGKPIQTSALILFLYLRRLNKLSRTFTFFDFVYQIEQLRENPPSNQEERKWLGFILSIYPTKYFIQPTIFNQGFPERLGEGKQRTPEVLQPIDGDAIYNEVLGWDDFSEYNTDMSQFTWEKLNKHSITCNTPIINSNVEWCTFPYLKEGTPCPPQPFFSGFYSEKPKCLEYGMFRCPKEIKGVIDILDKATDVILYKDIIYKTPRPLRALGPSHPNGGQRRDLPRSDPSEHARRVYNEFHMF